MKNIIFEKTVNANDAPMRTHMPRCTDADVIIMEKCGWHIWKIIYDSEAKKNGSGQVKSKYAENNLARLRVAAGLTQQQLANAAGINIRMIQKFESGERSLKTARADTLMAIAGALGVKIEKLL